MDAIHAVEMLPALLESRDVLLKSIGADNPSTDDLVSVVESDVALLIGSMRMAGSRKGGFDSATCAVEALEPAALRELGESVRTFDFFDRSGAWGAAAGAFRLHALATRSAAEQIASAINYRNTERLVLCSMLHDVGKLVLMSASSDYPTRVHGSAARPEERLRREQTELGVDHAVVGGVLIRRWGLPASVAEPIEHHHSREAEGEAAIVRLADMVAHHAHGESVSPSEMVASAAAVGLKRADLRGLLYDAPNVGITRRHRVDPSPLTARESAVLACLSKGMLYKQIALEMSLSVSTVRTHLHNIYVKLGAVDRAQAVLIATRRGWS